MQRARALPASGSSGAPTDIGLQPVFYKSMLDSLGTEPWVHMPTPIFAIVMEEGIDFPFSTRTTLDGVVPSALYRRRDERAHVHPQVQGVSLVILTPVDETILALGQEVYEGPSVADRVKRLRARQKITTTWATEYDASRFAFLPATAYADSSCRIFSEIQRHFLENTIDDGITWSLWSAAEVQAAYDRRMSRFLLESEFIRERRTVVVNAGQAVYDLPTDTISVCRIALGDDVLTRVDEWQMDNGVVGWEVGSGTPFGYIEDSSAGSLKVTLTPTPSANGVLNLIIVPEPGAGARCTPTPIPAVFSPYVKWGVIADLLSKEGEANDPVRAQYAEGRFAEGVEIAKLYTAGRGR